MEIQNQESARSRLHHKIRQKKYSTRLDMTPMVDLAFLLLTFFIFTTSFRNNFVIDLVVPDNPKTPNLTKIAESMAFNLVLLPENKVQWYIGGADKIVTSKEASLNGPDDIQNVLNEINSVVLKKIALVKDSVVRGHCRN